MLPGTGIVPARGKVSRGFKVHPGNQGGRQLSSPLDAASFWGGTIQGDKARVIDSCDTSDGITGMTSICEWALGPVDICKEEWTIKNNAHEPLITEDVAGVIREIRERGLREESCHATHIYPLSGTLKCAKCGTNYTGDRGLYRCNSLSKTGGRCGNNDIVQGRVEQAIFEFIRQRVLRFKDLKKVIDRIKMRFKTGEPEIDSLEKRLSRNEREMKRLVDLYRREIIDAETIESEMRPLREQKESMLSELGKSRMAKRGLDLTDDDLKKGIEHLSEKLETADPKIKKRAVQALLGEVRIYPKDGKTRDRLLEIIGVYFPLVRVNVVVPTGLEPVLPT